MNPQAGRKRTLAQMGDYGFREFFQVKHIQWPIR